MGSMPEEILRSPDVAVSQYEDLSLGTSSALLVLLRETFYVALGEEIFFRRLLGGVLFRRVGFAPGNVLRAALLLLPMMPLRGRRM